MSRGRPRKTAVYDLLDGDPGVYGLCRYSGDPDEFTALVHDWLIRDKDGYFDAPMGLLPPEPRLYRFNPDPSGEYGWLLGEPRRPGRGVFVGSLVKLVQIGCEECQHVGGRHHPSGCLNSNVVALETCQISGKDIGRRAPEMIHLVRVRGPQPGLAGGTPGPTLCDLDRFGPGISFSMGGGYTAEGMKIKACYMCVNRARRFLPGLPVQTSMREFAHAYAEVGMSLTTNWAEHLARHAAASTV